VVLPSRPGELAAASGSVRTIAERVWWAGDVTSITRSLTHGCVMRRSTFRSTTRKLSGTTIVRTAPAELT
jgi:hypothetical protein